MSLDETRQRASQERLAAYLDAIGAVLGHAGWASALRAYCTGLLLPGKRKSVELLAARVDPARVGATHQSLHHFVANAAWDEAAVFWAVRERVLPALERRGPVRHWIVDELCLPKQGTRSVGVAVQPCGGSDKPGNRQVAVMLSAANDDAGLPVAHRLHLPREWAGDPRRRAEAGVPAEVAFRTKAEIALGQVRRALGDGVPAGVVLGDAGYGGDAGFRAGVDGMGLRYVLGVPPSAAVWPCGDPPRAGRGRAPARHAGRYAGRYGGEQAGERRPVSARELAERLPPHAWRKAGRRGGERGGPPSRFAAVRVCPAHGDAPNAAATPEDRSPEGWLLVEWPEHEAAPVGYWLSNLPPCSRPHELAAAAEARRRAERDRQALEQEIGLAHYEGRGWRGFHHHASLCVAAYGFLLAERCLLPPRRRFSAGRLALPELPQGFRPRGAAPPVSPARAAVGPTDPATPDENSGR